MFYGLNAGIQLLYFRTVYTHPGFDRENSTIIVLGIVSKKRLWSEVYEKYKNYVYVSLWKWFAL